MLALFRATEFDLVIVTLLLSRNDQLIETEETFGECQAKCIARC